MEPVIIELIMIGGGFGGFRGARAPVTLEALQSDRCFSVTDASRMPPDGASFFHLVVHSAWCMRCCVKLPAKPTTINQIAEQSNSHRHVLFVPDALGCETMHVVMLDNHMVSPLQVKVTSMIFVSMDI